MAETSIEWTDYTFNPVEGCQRVSPGCVNCYAERKNKWLRHGQNWGPGTPRLQRSEAYWKQPLKWNREAGAAGQRRKVFCASVADVFEDHPDWVTPRARLFDLIQATRHLDWLLLTKRPQNVERFSPAWGGLPPNVWLGTTVEDDERCVRIPMLRSVPAAVHFLSCEPLLERIHPDLTGIDWVICGGESGPGARPFDVEWARSLKRDCETAGVAFFMKQLGVHTRMRPAEVGGDAELAPMVFPMRKGEAGDPRTWPADLRVRQFPEVHNG